MNEMLREVLAEELERLGDADERLSLLTVTGVRCDPDLRHAAVYLGSLAEGAAEALEEARVRLQAAIARQARLKRTPQLEFLADPAVREGQRVEEILRSLNREGRDGGGGQGPTGQGPGGDEGSQPGESR